MFTRFECLSCWNWSSENKDECFSGYHWQGGRSEKLEARLHNQKGLRVNTHHHGKQRERQIAAAPRGISRIFLSTTPPTPTPPNPIVTGFISQLQASSKRDRAIRKSAKSWLHQTSTTSHQLNIFTINRICPNGSIGADMQKCHSYAVIVYSENSPLPSPSPMMLFIPTTII